LLNKKILKRISIIFSVSVELISETSITLDGKRITIYTRCIDVRKTYEFNTIYNKAGNETHKLSLTLSLAITPKNISKTKPPEEISKIE
jgi:hypothetical protein